MSVRVLISKFLKSLKKISLPRVLTALVGGIFSAILISCAGFGGGASSDIAGTGPLGGGVGGGPGGGFGATGPSVQLTEDGSVRMGPSYVRIKTHMAGEQHTSNTSGNTGTAKLLGNQNSIDTSGQVLDAEFTPDSGFHVMYSRSLRPFADAMLNNEFQSVPTNANGEVDVESGFMLREGGPSGSCEAYFHYWACRKIGDVYYQSQTLTLKCPQGNHQAPVGSPENPGNTTLILRLSEGDTCPQTPPDLDRVNESISG